MLNPFFLILDPTTYRGVLVLSIIVLAVLSLGSLAAMVAHKAFIEFRDAVSLRLRQSHAEDAQRLLENEIPALPVPQAGISFDALADAVIPILQERQEHDAARLLDEVRRVGLVDHLRHVLQTSRSWIRRYRALERLGFLLIEELRPLFRKMIQEDRDHQLMPKAMWGLSFMAEAEDLDLLVLFDQRQRLGSAKFTEYVLTNMIRSFRVTYGDAGTLCRLQEFLDRPDADGILKRALVEACGRSGFASFGETAIDLFKNNPEDTAMRITALRAIGELRPAGICGVLGKALGDADWRLRLVAARYAHVCRHEALAHLETLLEDANYHVRLHAARSLFRLGNDGKDILRRVAEVGSDRFARDVSRYVLGET